MSESTEVTSAVPTSGSSTFSETNNNSNNNPDIESWILMPLDDDWNTKPDRLISTTPASSTTRSITSNAPVSATPSTTTTTSDPFDPKLFDNSVAAARGPLSPTPVVPDGNDRASYVDPKSNEEWFWYFAIGSMINPTSLSLRKLTPLESYPAVLRKWRLVFRGDCGMASVLPCESTLPSMRNHPVSRDNFHGVLHRLNREQMAKLDVIENSYDRLEVDVECYDGKLQKATVYKMCEEKLDPSKADALPSERYLDIISRGCYHFGVHKEYINWLLSHDCVKRKKPSEYKKIPIHQLHQSGAKRLNMTANELIKYDGRAMTEEEIMIEDAEMLRRLNGESVSPVRRKFTSPKSPGGAHTTDAGTQSDASPEPPQHPQPLPSPSPDVSPYPYLAMSPLPQPHPPAVSSISQSNEPYVANSILPIVIDTALPSPSPPVVNVQSPESSTCDELKPPTALQDASPSSSCDSASRSASASPNCSPSTSPSVSPSLTPSPLPPYLVRHVPLRIAVNKKILEWIGDLSQPLFYNTFAFISANFGGTDLTHSYTCVFFEPLYPIVNNYEEMSTEHRAMVEDIFYDKCFNPVELKREWKLIGFLSNEEQKTSQRTGREKLRRIRQQKNKRVIRVKRSSSVGGDRDASLVRDPSAGPGTAHSRASEFSEAEGDEGEANVEVEYDPIFLNLSMEDHSGASSTCFAFCCAGAQPFDLQELAQTRKAHHPHAHSHHHQPHPLSTTAASGHHHHHHHHSHRAAKPEHGSHGSSSATGVAKVLKGSATPGAATSSLRDRRSKVERNRRHSIGNVGQHSVSAPNSTTAAAVSSASSSSSAAAAPPPTVCKCTPATSGNENSDSCSASNCIGKPIATSASESSPLPESKFQDATTERTPENAIDGEHAFHRLAISNPTPSK